MELLIFPGIPLFCAIWVYRDANSRQSSVPLLWAILVFSLLIIFLPLYLLVRPSKKSIIESTVLCPSCGKYHKSTDVFCPYCGQSIKMPSDSISSDSIVSNQSETSTINTIFTTLKDMKNQSLVESEKSNMEQEIVTKLQERNHKNIEINSLNPNLSDSDTTSKLTVDDEKHIKNDYKSNNFLIVEYPKNNISERIMGNSLNYIPENYIIIDLETTGLKPREDNIIEIGCIKIHEGEEVDRFETLVCPPDSIPKRITKITGIDDDMVVSAPKFEDIAQKLWDFLEDEIIVGHNIKFDINFLYENFLKSLGLQFHNDYVDTLPLSRRMYPDFESYRLEDIAEKLKIESNHHRAIDDCLVVKKIIDFMQENQAGTVVNFENLNAEDISKDTLKILRTLEDDDYVTFEQILYLCNNLVDKNLATAKLCKKMASVCEKFEEYEEAISFYEAAMDIDPELDFYKKIERLEKKIYDF